MNFQNNSLLKKKIQETRILKLGLSYAEGLLTLLILHCTACFRLLLRGPRVLAAASPS